MLTVEIVLLNCIVYNVIVSICTDTVSYIDFCFKRVPVLANQSVHVEATEPQS